MGARRFAEKFQLSVCGRRLNAGETRHLLTGCSLIVTVLLILLLVSTAMDGDESVSTPDTAKAKALLDSGQAVFPYRFLVDKQCVPSESCRDDSECGFHSRFEQAIVKALSDEEDGLGRTHDNDPKTSYRIDMSQLAVARINRDPDKFYCVDASGTFDGRSCTGVFTPAECPNSMSCTQQNRVNSRDTAVVTVYFVVPAATITAETVQKCDPNSLKCEMIQVDPALAIVRNLEYQLTKDTAGDSSCISKGSPPPPPHTCQLVKPCDTRSPACKNPTGCIMNTRDINRLLNIAYSTSQLARDKRSDSITWEGGCHFVSPYIRLPACQYIVLHLQAAS